MPKGAKLSAEEQVKQILEKQKERIRKIQERDREKLRKLESALNKERQARQAAAGNELEKIYRESAGNLDTKKVLALCEKYWKILTDVKSPSEKVEKEKKSEVAS